MIRQIAGGFRKMMALPKLLLVFFFRRPRLVVALGILSLCALVWFAGDTLGMASPEIRLLLIAGIILAWVLFLMVDVYRMRHGAQMLEDSLQQQGVAQSERSPSEQKEDIEAVRLRFEKAIATLKQSKLGKGYRGKAALYALPWYMIIGPSASGKSTALRESGLQFPFLGENQKGIQGVGGTRNCDWWFTTDAVLLDTAGRYMTEDEDREEWIGFLELLKKTRSKKPINGVMVAIGIDELLRASDQLIEWHAKTIRDRIDELMTHLGMAFPVYLMFTKCDLLEGFVQFFGEMGKSEREQIWGCTLPRRTKTALPPHEVFEQEFTHMIEGIQTRRLERFAMTRGEGKLSILGFPLQLESCRPVLTRFIEVLFHQNPYQENPFFRGCYFTSGTQEGSPIDRIIDSVRQAAGLKSADGGGQSHLEPKSYFIKKLFTDVIFPDQPLASPSSRAFQQRGILRVAIFGAAIIGVGLSVFAMGSSYLGNKVLVKSVQDSAVKLVQVSRQGIPMVGSQDYLNNLELLSRLQGRLAQIQDYQDRGIPLLLQGFYRGDRLYDPLKMLYYRELSHVIVDPTQRGIEARLSRFVHAREADGKEEDSYALFKAYLMLSDPEHLDREFLNHQLQRLWKAGSPIVFARGDEKVPEEYRKHLQDNLAFFSRYLAGQYPITPDRDLVQEVRNVLRATPLKERLFQQAVQQASEGLEPYTLQTALEGYQQPHLISDYQIPGVYTKHGWEKAFQKQLDGVLEEYAKDYWVLGEKEPLNTEMVEAVKSQYFGQYSRHWFQFLSSIQVRPNRAQADILTLLQGLTTSPSPIAIILEEAKKHTGFQDSVVGQVGQEMTGMIEKITKKFFSESQNWNTPGLQNFSPSSPASLTRDFRSLHRFLETPQKEEGAQSGLQQYLAELNHVKAVMVGMSSSAGTMVDPIQLGQRIVQGEANEITKAVYTVQQLVANFDLKTQKALEPMLVQPVLVSMQSVLDQALLALDRQWVTEVFEPCQQTIASYYPFQISDKDAAIGDVASYFHPDQGRLWSFVNKKIQPFVVESQGGWTPRDWRGIHLALSAETLDALRYAKFLTAGLFQGGQAAPSVPFDLFPYSDQGPSASLVSHIVFKIGDQDFVYDMGPREWQEMTWPGPSGVTGSQLLVKINGVWESREAQGWWGLFRLLDLAQVTPKSDSQYQVVWAWNTSDSKPLRIQYDLKARKAQNPFQPHFFRKFSCISHLAEAT
jgi:type VI secretion system protein ImpL